MKMELFGQVAPGARAKTAGAGFSRESARAGAARAAQSARAAVRSPAVHAKKKPASERAFSAT
ncbi:hypothetical protein LG3211_3172 [Lysobacter gummosus]|nr:hypothetical protein LG3211_3172 [Lysobacter gummosus]